MSNQQLKQKISNVWKSLKGLKANQIQNKIQLSKQLAQTIVGIGELDKIRNSTLLKLLSYELISFVDDKMNSNQRGTTYFSSEHGRNHDNADNLGVNIREIKQILQMLYDIAEKSQPSSSYIKVDRYYLNSILKKVHIIEEELKQDSIKRKFENIRNEDPEGTEAMIEQLQVLLKKKQARIKELNSQLQENFNDKEQLETEIQALEQRNYQLEETVKALEDQCNLVKDEFEKYKAAQKQQLLFGASEFMNRKFSHKQVESPLLAESKNSIPADMLTSTQMLSQYCAKPELKLEQLQTPEKQKSDVKTVKKPMFKQVEEETFEEEQNLLQSMRIYKKSSEPKSKDGDSEMLSRMLLMQASFIEQVMAKILD